ncbi:hypothetical protein HK102_009298 [Quaeritorhiza haematococci]|nr:hypothetical protein HK102_009298 [Quaeritorhiza haematococci]
MMLSRAAASTLAKRAFSSSAPVAAAAIAAAPEVFFPSVLRLIRDNHIPDETVQRIPRSGPKNRLLKGDVLRYLSDPNVLSDTPLAPSPAATESISLEETGIPHAYYSKVVDLEQLTTFLNGKQGVAINDVFVRATALAINAVPQVNVQWKESKSGPEVPSLVTMYVARSSPSGLSAATVENPISVKASKVSGSLKPSLYIQPTGDGVFCLYDQTLHPTIPILSPQITAGTTTSILHISQLESRGGVRSPSQRTMKELSLFDFLGGVENKPASVAISTKRAAVMDILDELGGGSKAGKSTSRARSAPKTASNVEAAPQKPASPSSSTNPFADFLPHTLSGAKQSVNLELVVDSRAVSSSIAHKFLAVWSKLIAEPAKLL